MTPRDEPLKNVGASVRARLTDTRSAREEDEDVGLRELDGILPWPGKSRRRRYAIPLI